MPIRWNIKGEINWPQLDRKLTEQWEQKAGAASGVERFVFAFIVVNHYYSAWAAMSGRRFPSERDEAIHLATVPALAAWWPKFVKLHDVKGRKIPLPIADRRGRDVPGALAPAQYEAAQLSPEQWLSVVYQLRCDFFHAQRSAVGYHNEVAVRFVSEPVLNLVRFLGMQTTLR